MTDVFVRRATVVLGVLVAATIASVWVGSSHPAAGSWLAAIPILIAFAKVFLVGQDFMGLREAHPALRGAFLLWVCSFGLTCAILYVA
jgi:hypothetical protein